MRRRIVSIWLPRVETDLLARRRPHWRDWPLALYRETGPRLIVTAANAPAEAEGVRPGMALADARALLADLATAPHAPNRLARAQKALLRWLDRFTPLAALDGPDGFFLDVTGVAHLFGGERAFLDRLIEQIEDLGLAVRAGLASTPGAAWALARYDRQGRIAGPGETRAALAPLPVGALRLETETEHRLARLGLKRVEDLLALPRPALVRRFGVQTVFRIDQALGVEPEPISPERPPAPYRVRLPFPELMGRREAIEEALRRLIDKLAARLADDDLGAEALALTVCRADGGRQQLDVRAAEPTRDAKRIARLFQERLDEIDPGFGIEAAELVATQTGRIAPRQRDALAGRATPDALTNLLDALGNRLGFDAVARFRPEDRWQPDRCFGFTPARDEADAPAWPAPPGPRPLTLLQRPEPVRVEAAADGLQAPVALCRRGRWRRLAATAGPERIAPEWREPDPAWPAARDYWRAQDEAGERLWLYRQGADWYLHGFFA